MKCDCSALNSRISLSLRRCIVGLHILAFTFGAAYYFGLMDANAAGMGCTHITLTPGESYNVAKSPGLLNSGNEILPISTESRWQLASNSEQRFASSPPGAEVRNYEAVLQSMSGSLAQGLARSGVKTVGVIDFTAPDGQVSDLSRFISEELSTALAGRATSFHLLDRAHINRILQEQKLSSGGLIDPQTVIKVGRIAGAGALLTGTVTPMQGQIRVLAKAVDSESAQVIGAADGTLTLDRDMSALLGIKNDRPEPTPEPGQKTVRSPRTAARETVGPFSFENVECKRSGTNVYCSVSITNSSPNELLLCIGNYKPGTFAQLSSGMRIPANSFELGGSQTFGGAHQRVLPNVPVLAHYMFANIPPREHSIQLIMSCTANDCSAVFGTGFHMVFSHVLIDD